MARGSRNPHSVATVYLSFIMFKRNPNCVNMLPVVLVFLIQIIYNTFSIKTTLNHEKKTKDSPHLALGD